MESIGGVEAITYCFYLLGAVASRVNHIDDTDETYGYWEPLHYITHNKGMQTWEYAPQYAIRSFSFILPLSPLNILCNAMKIHKIELFYIIKAVLGIIFAFASASYIRALKKAYGPRLALYSALFMLAAPGIFFASTAYLPSAVCMSLFMLSVSSWIQQQFIPAVFYGSLAVIWSGWPFVALLYVPLGAHMLWYRWMHPSGNNKTPSFLKRAVSVGTLCLQGLLVVFVSAIGSLAIDTYMYDKVTFPPLNIALYNAFGGTGDELYGVEPASYYVMNLLLTVGLVSFPLIVISPLTLLLQPQASNTSQYKSTPPALIVLCAPAVLWLAVMFSRPHKEERFLYPIYPVLTTMAAHTLVCVCDMFESTLSRFLNGATTSVLRRIAILFVFALAITCGVSRVVASRKNYGGYMNLWSQVHAVVPSSNTTVCMGGDWYTFPSHFFLPEQAHLGYVEDNFHGLLPQPFPPGPRGASRTPLLPVNDRNEEERSHYIPLNSCDYVVMTTPACAGLGVASGEAHCTAEDQLTPLQQSILGPISQFTPLHCEDIIDPKNSVSSLARAFYIPRLSEKSNRFMQYCLYSRSSTKEKN